MNSRDTRWTSGFGGVACAVVALLVAAAPAIAVDSAVREYSLNLPNPEGKTASGSQVPGARPSELAPLVRRALEKSPDGSALATVATSLELGAPVTATGGPTPIAPGESDGGQTPSVAAAVIQALDDPPLILGLLGLLGLIGLLALLARPPRTGTKA